MRIWIKAILITTIIATIVLFFEAYWFVGKHKKMSNIEAAITSHKPLHTAKSIKLLKDSLFVSTIPENYSNFALRLSSYYAKAAQYDSAARYKELIASRFPNEENWINAGLMYYKAFKNASGEHEEKKMANKAIVFLEKSKSLTIEVKLALANLYLSYNKPNKASLLFNEVLIMDATNKEALYQLGIYSYQNNNFDNANEYLGQLIKSDSSYIEGLYFLAITQLKLGKTEEAKVLFKKIKLLDISVEVEANVDNYLLEIK